MSQEPAAGGQEVCTTLFTLDTERSDSAGFDTVRFLFRCSDMPSHLFRQGPKRPFPAIDSRTGQVSDSGLVCGPVQLAEGRPAVWVEGRPDQLVNGRGHDELLPVDRLPECESIARENLSRLGVELDSRCPTEVARVDTTASVEVGGSVAVQAVLRSFHSSKFPRRKWAIYGHPKIETLYLKGTAGRVFERIYPEGPKHGEGRERFVRFEAQNRFTSRNRLPVSEWSRDRAAAVFADRFGTTRERLGVVVVGNFDAISHELTRLASEGQLSNAMAMNLMGYLVHRRSGNHLSLLADSTARRYEAELRRVGLDIDERLESPLRVDLAELLDRTMLSWN
jgi:hypothetical protein